MTDRLQKSPRTIYLILTCIFLVVLLKDAWLSDDAYVTFRTVKNFVHGYGLTWNIGERVQAYTHPLWMFCLSALYFVTGDLYYTPIFWSIGLSLLTVGVVIKLVGHYPNSIFALVLLLLSKSYIDYATSGLENPLTHLLLALLLLVYYRDNGQKIFILSLITTCLLLNRMDLGLLTLPPLLYIWWQHRSWRSGSAVSLGLSPFFLWEGFSLVYYGFPFPNTAYAKLNHGLESIQLVEQGLYYLLISLWHDPMILLVLSSLAYPIVFRKKHRVKGTPPTWPLILGMWLYLLYILRIGGDFMVGRFFSGLILWAVILHARTLLLSPKRIWMLIGGSLLVGLLFPDPPLLRHDFSQPSTMLGVADEIRHHYRYTGFLTVFLEGQQTHLVARRQGLHPKRPTAFAVHNIGLSGYHAGSALHLVDRTALADPLLARLPSKMTLLWRIGHFERTLPEGYIDILRAKRHHLSDPNLDHYYDKLTLVTRSPLFDPIRWLEIWRLNTGYYDHLIDWSAYRYPEQVVLDGQSLTKNNSGQAIALNRSGLKFQWSTVKTARQVEISLSQGYYQFIYLKQGHIVAQQVMWLRGQSMEDAWLMPWITRLVAILDDQQLADRNVVVYRFDVPKVAHQQGYDQMMLIPLGMDLAEYKVLRFGLIE